MTRTEAAAFNAGVHAVFKLARKTAAALNGASNTHHLRTRAAIAAREDLAENAQALLIGASPVAVNRDAAEPDDGV